MKNILKSSNALAVVMGVFSSVVAFAEGTPATGPVTINCYGSTNDLQMNYTVAAKFESAAFPRKGTAQLEVLERNVRGALVVAHKKIPVTQDELGDDLRSRGLKDDYFALQFDAQISLRGNARGIVVAGLYSDFLVDVMASHIDDDEIIGGDRTLPLFCEPEALKK